MAKNDLQTEPELELSTTRWVECPSCGNLVTYMFLLVGQQVQCPHCWQNFDMPQLPPLVRRRFGWYDESLGLRLWFLLMALASVSGVIFTSRSEIAMFGPGLVFPAGFFGFIAYWLPAKKSDAQRLRGEVAESLAFAVFSTIGMAGLMGAVMGGALLGFAIDKPYGRVIGPIAGLLVGSYIWSFTTIRLFRWLVARHLRRQQGRGMSSDGTFSTCPSCGYEPLGPIPDWCPECGKSFRPYGDLKETLTELRLDPDRILSASVEPPVIAELAEPDSEDDVS